MQGLILFAHGARDRRWADPFDRAADRFRQLRPGVAVTVAYLEFITPDLATAASQLVALGCDDIRVLPLFLGAGGHVRKDLPAKLGELRATFPDVRWSLETAAGESPIVIEALAQVASGLFPIQHEAHP